MKVSIVYANTSAPTAPPDTKPATPKPDRRTSPPPTKQPAPDSVPNPGHNPDHGNEPLPGICPINDP